MRWEHCTYRKTSQFSNGFTENEEKWILRCSKYQQRLDFSLQTLYKIFTVQTENDQDLSILWITELILTTLSENCFTSVSHGDGQPTFCHLWTGISAQDDLTTPHSSSAYLGFASEQLHLKLFWAGRSIPFNFVGLELRCCSLTAGFEVIRVQELFLFDTRQHDLIPI